MGTIDDVVSNMKNGVTNLAQLISAIKNVFPQMTGTATTATTGSAGSLPAQPAGYLISTLPNGTTVKFPYYNL